MYQTDLYIIAVEAERKEEENDNFLRWVKKYQDSDLDSVVHKLTDEVSAGIDCTACGNCCRTLVINVEPEEIIPLAAHLNKSEEAFKQQYIEESMAGRCFINTIPCHFFADSKCTVYEHRFRECHDFPHLHKPGFKGRLLGTLGHYGRCPIIYNVIERLKVKLGFSAT